METIKVNMTPCEDVQTIHASQNDNEAREWGFELHNNGDVIDSSEISDQLVFKAYEGGTEQILPENTSTPTTSPFLGDIRYPQGLLTDQEFIYRQSPTESDGLAKIQTIYGNTLKWNQLINNNNAGSTITTNGITFTKNADGSITLNGTATAQADYNFARIDYINGHKYLVNGIPSGATENGYKAFVFSRSLIENTIVTPSIDDWFTPRIRVSSGVTVSNVVFRLNIFDLTLMFGSGNEPTYINEFMSLFPLQYSYDSGSLLPFRGEGLKTVGFNQWDEEWKVGGLNTVDGTPQANPSTIRSKNFSPCVSGASYYVKCANYTNRYALCVYWYDADQVFVSREYACATVTTAPANAKYFKIVTNSSGTVYGATYNHDICINISDTSRNGQYEPYTENTLSLPVSTYFPNGMNGVGTAHDELRNDGTTLRMALLNLGILNWISEEDNGAGKFRATPSLMNALYHGEVILPKYTNNKSGNYLNMENMEVSMTNAQSAPMLRIRNESFAGYTVAQVKEAFQNVYMAYELRTPIENFGVVDLGSLEWVMNDSSTKIFRCQPTGMNYVVSDPYENRQNGAMCYKYSPSQNFSISSSMNDKSWLRSGYDFFVRDTSYSDAVAFKQAMSGVYLLYEKENPQGFTTATLVTENGEVALANENGVLVGKCNSDISADAGFIEGKIKLSDEDGDVYSNKIQIHVERSPQ